MVMKVRHPWRFILFRNYPRRSPLRISAISQIRAKMSFVNSPSPDFFHGLGNFENDGMTPAPNCHIYQEEEIPSENYSHEPSASNSDPNMIDASMMNTATMSLIQHGVTPATNWVFFQEKGIANTSILKDSTEENGDLRHGGFTYSGDTNYQETLTRAGNHDTLIHHTSTMSTATIIVTQHGVTPATNSMNFQETSAMTSIVNMSSHKVIHGGLGNFPPHERVPPETNHYVKEGYTLVEGCLMPSGNMNFQGRELENSLLSISSIGVNNSMPSTSNPVPNMIHAPMMNTATMLLTQHGMTPATN